MFDLLLFCSLNYSGSHSITVPSIQVHLSFVETPTRSTHRRVLLPNHALGLRARRAFQCRHISPPSSLKYQRHPPVVFSSLPLLLIAFARTSVLASVCWLVEEWEGAREDGCCISDWVGASGWLQEGENYLRCQARWMAMNRGFKQCEGRCQGRCFEMRAIHGG